MKAWILSNIGDFKLKETEKPQVSDGHVLVKVCAAGICGSDIQRVYENGAHRMPLIIGHEFSGQVEAAGRYVPDEWIGKRVGIFPLIPCRHCLACMKKKYEMCSQYSYLGSRTDGGFAEYAQVPEWNLIELPDEVSYEQAAMMEPMAVAVHAMRRVKIHKDAKVAVAGLGTIGQLLIMFLLDCGIENIYAVGKSEVQKAAVAALGISEERYIDSGKADVPETLKERTNGHGVEVFFDCVGKTETARMALEGTAAGGQVCIVGNPYSDMHFERDTWWKLLRKQLRVTGTWNSSYLGADDEEAPADDWNYVVSRLREGRVHPERLITHRLLMEELEKGFLIMRGKTESYTKIMMVQP